MLYKTSPMTRSAWIVLIVLSVSISSAAQNPPQNNLEKPGFAARVAGLSRKGGFFPYYMDEKKGELLFELSPAVLGREFLYFTALGSGVGSTEMFADRSSFGGSMVCHLRRAGMRVLV